MRTARKGSLTASANMNNLKRMAKPRKVLKSAVDVIDRGFGGTLKAAQWADCSMQAVSQWRKDGVPPGHHYRMAKYLEAKGFIVDGPALGWT